MKVFALIFSVMVVGYSYLTTQKGITAQPQPVQNLNSPSQFSYTILKNGVGAAALPGHVATIYETIRYQSGKTILDLKSRSIPATFRIGADQVISALDEGVRGMQAGEIRRLIVPPAYSKRTQYPSGLSPDSTLVYEIELVRLETSALLFKSTDMGASWIDMHNYVALPGYMEPENVFKPKSRSGFEMTDLSAQGDATWTLNDMDYLFHNTDLFYLDQAAYTKVFRCGFNFNSVYDHKQEKAVRSVLRTPNTFFFGTDGGIFASGDEGKSWNKVFAESGITDLTESNGVILGANFSALPVSFKTTLEPKGATPGPASKGIVRSADGGNHWEWILKDNKSTNLEVIDGQFVTIGEGTIRASGDGGNTWRDIDHGLPADETATSLIKAGNYLFSSFESGIYRSSDWGKHWEVIYTPAKNQPLKLIYSDGVIYGCFVGC